MSSNKNNNKNNKKQESKNINCGRTKYINCQDCTLENRLRLIPHHVCWIWARKSNINAQGIVLFFSLISYLSIKDILQGVKMWLFSKKPVQVDNDWRDVVRANIATDIFRSFLFSPGRSKCKPNASLSRPIVIIKYEGKEWIGIKRYGLAGEQRLLWYLKSFYPNIELKLANGKQVYDIYSDRAMFDNVGVDNQNRLIMDHKVGLYEHRLLSRIRGIPGYIAFEYDNAYWFISVNSKIFRLNRPLRPKINGYLLRSCVKILFATQ